MNNILSTALSQYGISEMPGEEKNNPEILKYFDIIGQKWVKTDETAWCSAFVNWCAKMSGYDFTGKLNARSWLDIGHNVIKPVQGDIVIFWRELPNSWKGHVGIYISESLTDIYVLSGNQSNKVCIKPYKKTRLLGYRRLNKL